jgi:hypothetical protein
MAEGTSGNVKDARCGARSAGTHAVAGIAKKRDGLENGFVRFHGEELFGKEWIGELI